MTRSGRWRWRFRVARHVALLVGILISTAIIAQRGSSMICSFLDEYMLHLVSTIITTVFAGACGFFGRVLWDAVRREYRARERSTVCRQRLSDEDS